MRGLLILVAACGGAPPAPAHLEELGDIPFTGQQLPAAFDENNQLLLMDGNTGLRRFDGTRLVTIPNGGNFAFGSFGVDRDGTLLIGSSFGQLARFETGDLIVNIQPSPPFSFVGSAGVPSGAYHLAQSGGITTQVLPAGGTAWEDSLRRLDRTLRAPSGAIYAIENDDIVELDSNDAGVAVGSCAELAGGTCPFLEFGGVDANGHLFIVLPERPSFHILDPSAGAFREIVMPEPIEVVSATAGSQYAVVIGSDPDRNDEQSLWLLEPDSDEVLRFTTLGQQSFDPIQLIADHAGNIYTLGQSKLRMVVLD